MMIMMIIMRNIGMSNDNDNNTDIIIDINDSNYNLGRARTAPRAATSRRTLALIESLG